MVGADRGELERPEPFPGLGGRDAGEGFCALVEGQRRDDRERRDAPSGFDRGLELVELVERLDHEEVDAATVEDPCLLGEDLHALVSREALRVAEGPDRAGDEHVAPGDLAGLARQLHAGAVDPLQLVLQVEPCELAAVGAERVRLDQIGTGPDEARVERDDALGGFEIGLLGTAEARDGARDENAHAAVGDDDGAVEQTLFEPSCHAAMLVKCSRQPSMGDRSSEASEAILGLQRQSARCGGAAQSKRFGPCAAGPYRM